MKRSSQVERSIKESSFVMKGLSTSEKKIFRKIKRSLMRTFVAPNHSVKIMIDLTAMEYVRYFRQPVEGDEKINPAQRTKLVSSIKDCLSELDLTPASKKSGEVGTTLSQIFKNLEETKNGKQTGSSQVDATGEGTVLN